MDIVLPLIALLAEHPNTKQLTAFTRRIRRNYFDGLWAKDENNVATRRGQNKMDWRYLIQIINQVEDKDLLNIENEKITFSKIPLIDIPIWYDKNEQIKDKLRKEHPEAIDLWEDNEYLMGDLTPLWNDCNKEDIDFETLKERFLKIDKLCRMLNEDQVKKKNTSSRIGIDCTV